MDIGNDDDDNPEQPVAGLAIEGEATQADTARAAPSAPKAGSRMQQKEMPDEAQVEVGASYEKASPEPPQVVEKRKTRSHGSVEELELPASKRSQGKSKSPPLVTETSESQPTMPQETKLEIPPRSGNQVPLRHVFDRLVGVFSYPDSLECVWEVCTQEKAITPPAPKLTTQRPKKLRYLIPLDP
jgi:hypothetical protein